MNIYGAGLFIRKVMGWESLDHNGATAGYRACLQTFPELSLSFAILSNTSQFNINYVAYAVRKIFVPDKSVETQENKTGINLPDSVLNNFTGLYVNERDGSTFQLSVKNNHLILDSSTSLTTVSNNTFKTDNFRFEINGDNGLYISSSPVDIVHFKKVKPVAPAQKDFNIYEGKYFSDETNSLVSIQHDSSTLIIHLKPGADYPLIPTYADAFKINELDCDVKFVRKGKNGVFLMKMSVSRARNVEFERLK
jgi:hypothetical protein